MKIIIILLIGFVMMLLVSCSNSEIGDCYDICRNIAYLDLDNNCNWISSSPVLDKCEITNKQIIEIKNDCYNECKPK